MVSSGSGSGSGSSSSSDDDTRLPLPQEAESRGGDEGGSDTLTQYELLRLQRIQQNKSKLAALRLPGIASRLASSASEGKAKRLKLLHNECANSERRSLRAKKEKDDEDYEPSDSMGSETQSSDGDEEGEDDGNAQVPSDLKKKGKQTNRKNWKSSVPQDTSVVFSPSTNTAAEEDFDFQQAIALSLGESFHHTFAMKDHIVKQELNESVKEGCNKASEKIIVQKLVRSSKKNASSEKVLRKPTRRKSQLDMLQFTEGEFDALFFSFLGTSQAHILAEDLERISVAHDFTWDQAQIQDMIDLFDTDMDGQLSLEDFRDMGGRLKVLKEA